MREMLNALYSMSLKLMKNHKLKENGNQIATKCGGIEFGATENESLIVMNLLYGEFAVPCQLLKNTCQVQHFALV